MKKEGSEDSGVPPKLTLKGPFGIYSFLPGWKHYKGGLPEAVLGPSLSLPFLLPTSFLAAVRR